MKNERSRSMTRGPRAGALAGWGILGLVAAIALSLMWWRGAASSGEDGTVDLQRVVAVEARDVIDAVTATGRIEPIARVAVMSRASGIVESLHADEGDHVTAGQVLAELDREQLRAQLDQDEADLLAAKARVAAAAARLEEAAARVDDPEPAFLRREAERLEELVSNGTASPQERDSAQRELANAEFRVAMVRANLPVLEAAKVEAEAQLVAATAARDRSATALREATILCPIDGIVLLREKEVGDGISSILTAGGNATQLMVLGDLSEMHVEARVDEVDLGRIRAGLPALITVDAHRGVEFEGSVERIAPAGSVDDNGIVTFEVKVSIEDPDDLLRPDMTADARLVLARRDGVPSLPQVAVRADEDGGYSVLLVRGEGDEARSERREVRLGLSDGLMTEVLEGLEVGDRVLLPAPGRGR